jgi:hypothetical protein
MRENEFAQSLVSQKILGRTEKETEERWLNDGTWWIMYVSLFTFYLKKKLDGTQRSSGEDKGELRMQRRG